MKPSPSILLQVAGLVLVSVLAAQAFAVGVLLLSPPPPPPAISLAEVGQAFRARTARDLPPTLRRREVADAPDLGAGGLADLIAAGLADTLDVPPAAVRVTWIGRGAAATVVPRGGGAAFTVMRRLNDGTLMRPRPSDMAATRIAAAILLRDSGAVLPPFRAAVRGQDGRWTVVEPREPLLSPARLRVLAAFGLSLLALTPLVWWSARRLTRPVRLFAEAAERLGLDPAAPPLPVAGPAEVRDAAAAFNRMQGRLRRHADERAALTAALAHDLRTPLTGLRLRVEGADEPARGRMTADIARMEAMIAETLAFARGDRDGEARRPLDLAALAAVQVADAVARGDTATLDAPEPVWASGEPLALARALTNLIDNAVTYGRRAEVQVRTDAGLAVVRVRDEGPGLPEADLQRMLDPFTRGEPSRSRATGGAGLGLTLARSTARRHGGDLVLSNRPKGGLCATLTLPIAAPTP